MDASGGLEHEQRKHSIGQITAGLRAAPDAAMRGQSQMSRAKGGARLPSSEG